MKQILQSLKTGDIELCEVPVPALKSGHLLIRTRRSLISLGTERMLLSFGKAGWVEKARQQPDKVRQVLHKVKTDGIVPTVQAVMRKLDQPLPLGYSQSGIVLEVGNGVPDFKPGDRVVSNGFHAEFVCVPHHLCARIPETVTDDTACFTVVAAIALEGVRLVAPTLGERVAVLGLGLIGLLTCQLLRANGCQVLGFDFDPRKVDLARAAGAEAHVLSPDLDPVRVALEWTGQTGVDAVVITAATRSSEPSRQAPQMCRKRGRVVLVGVIGLELARDDFYKKEISFQVSCSYGPGRYDPAYEAKGLDYPIGFVRWTEQRNFQAILDLMRSGSVVVEDLVSEVFTISRAHEAYAGVIARPDALGLLLSYDGDADANLRVVHLSEQTSAVTATATAAVAIADPARPVVGFIGAGNFAATTLVAAFQESGAVLKTIASAQGVSGTHLGRKAGFQISTTDLTTIWEDPEINTVVITTPHHSHARLVCQALEAGKHVFVEKPLCLTLKELEEIESLYRRVCETDPRLLMVGFNRRFSPLTGTMKRLLDAAPGRKALIMTVNAGAIPAEHWTQDPEVGGGRLLGEGCHFVDFVRYLVGLPIQGRQIVALPGPEAGTPSDTFTINLTFADGSIGSIHYFANGHKGFPKERLDVFFGERILQLENFRNLVGHGVTGFSGQSLWAQDKGHAAGVAAFLAAVRTGKPCPIPFGEITEVARLCCDLAKEV